MLNRVTDRGPIPSDGRTVIGRFQVAVGGRSSGSEATQLRILKPPVG
jgi:hypothetical protein